MTAAELLLSWLARGLSVRAERGVLLVGPRPLPPGVEEEARARRGELLLLLGGGPLDPWADGWEGEAFSGQEWQALSGLRRAQAGR